MLKVYTSPKHLLSAPSWLSKLLSGFPQLDFPCLFLSMWANIVPPLVGYQSQHLEAEAGGVRANQWTELWPLGHVSESFLGPCSWGDCSGFCNSRKGIDLFQFCHVHNPRGNSLPQSLHEWCPEVMQHTGYKTVWGELASTWWFLSFKEISYCTHRLW